MFAPTTYAPVMVVVPSFRTPIRLATTALLLAGLAVSGGCATSPFPREIIQQARLQPSFEALRADPDAYKGITVIVGGTIIKTVNRSGHTEIEVLQKQLDSGYEPREIDTSGGRFLARCQGFLDPEIYSAGNEVTVAGEVEGKEERPVGDVPYTYPVIACQKVQLWYRQRGIYNYWGYYGYGPYGYGPYMYGWYGWYGWPYWPPSVVVVRPRHRH